MKTERNIANLINFRLCCISFNNNATVDCNSNCDCLTTERLLVLKQYNHEVANASKSNDNNFKLKLIHKWFDKKWPSFFTTRRILLGDAAEKHLLTIGYVG